MTALLTSHGEKGNIAEIVVPEGVDLFGTGFIVHPSFVTALIVSAVLIAVAIILRLTVIRRLKDVPGKVQSILEFIIEFFSANAEGKYGNVVGCYVTVAGVYIFFGTVSELVGLRPIFADLGGALSLGVVSFVMVVALSFRAKGKRRFLDYKNPFRIVLDLIIPVGLTAHLFGAVISGYILCEIAYSSLATSFVLPAVVSLLTTVLHALIQAYLYGKLTSLYIEEGID